MLHVQYYGKETDMAMDVSMFKEDIHYIWTLMEDYGVDAAIEDYGIGGVATYCWVDILKLNPFDKYHYMGFNDAMNTIYYSLKKIDPSVDVKFMEELREYYIANGKLVD